MLASPFLAEGADLVLEVLHPVRMTLVHWGNVHMGDERGRPLLHEHKTCGKVFDPVLTCSECGEPVTARDVRTQRGRQRR